MTIAAGINKRFNVIMKIVAEKKIKADYEKLGVITHEREVGQKSTRWKGERWTR